MTPPDDGASTQPLPAPPARLDRLALFLDLDGVLAPIAPTPEGVMPEPRRTALLAALQDRLDGRLAILSGRTLDEIDRITGDVVRAAAGVHGLQRRRPDGGMDQATAGAGLRSAHDALLTFAADWPGVRVEDKGLAIGLHYRQAPQAAKAARDLAEALARQTGLALQPGHMVLELKTQGADKGQALTAFMAEPPFHGFTPVMVGDDLTDEYGFEAAQRLGGFGVRVGPAQTTAARCGLTDVAAVLDWLEGLARA